MFIRPISSASVKYIPFKNVSTGQDSVDIDDYSFIWLNEAGEIIYCVPKIKKTEKKTIDEFKKGI